MITVPLKNIARSYLLSVNRLIMYKINTFCYDKTLSVEKLKQNIFNEFITSTLNGVILKIYKLAKTINQKKPSKE